jgi:hypothetical protein
MKMSFNSTRLFLLSAAVLMAGAGIVKAEPLRVSESGHYLCFGRNLIAAKGKTLEVRWYNPRRGQFRHAEEIDGGGSRQFTPSFQGDAVLHTESVVQIDARDPNEIANVPLWGFFETRLVNNHKYSNPFRDAILSAVFRSPSGKRIDFFGYYDGDGHDGQTGNVWKLRFMPDEVGTWSYVCRFSDGSGGKRGEFACVAQGAKPGPVRAEGRWLKFADGKWFYPRSYYFSEAFSGVSPYWEKTIETFFGGKYNYNFCCTTFWQGKLLRKNRWNNIDYNGFYPIHGKDYTRLDLRSWRHVDEVLQHLESHGVVWFNFDGFVPNVGGEMGPQRTDFEAQKVYIRNVVARLAPYWNVIWNIAFEWREFMSAEQVRRLVDFTKKIDPWAHLVTVHDQGGYKGSKELLAGLHVDLITLQYDAGKCGDAVTANRFVQRYAGSVPVYAQEVCWEADTKLNAEQLRKGAWGVVLAGGLLNYAEMFEGPNQGRPQNYGDGKAIHYLEILFDFMQSLPCRQMAPHNELLGKGCICFAEPAQCYVCYAPNGQTIRLDLSEAPGHFSGQWLNPRDGRKEPTTTIKGGTTQSFHCPDKNDWVFCLSRIE